MKTRVEWALANMNLLRVLWRRRAASIKNPSIRRVWIRTLKEQAGAREIRVPGILRPRVGKFKLSWWHRLWFRIRGVDSDASGWQFVVITGRKSKSSPQAQVALHEHGIIRGLIADNKDEEAAELLASEPNIGVSDWHSGLIVKLDYKRPDWVGKEK